MEYKMKKLEIEQNVKQREIQADILDIKSRSMRDNLLLYSGRDRWNKFKLCWESSGGDD